MDLAVIKSTKNLPYLKCNQENSLKVGEDVVAIVTPLTLDFKHTVTKGIVSANNRTLQVETDSGTINFMQNLIQHDASINPGNSGGPLINSSGEVIGINTLKASEAEGIGFAIPISVGISVLNHLRVDTSWQSAYLGVFGVDSEFAKFYGENVSANHGVYIVSVDKTGSLGKHIQKQDIIVEINGKTVSSILDLRLELYKYQIGDIINLKILRNYELKDITCVLESKA